MYAVVGSVLGGKLQFAVVGSVLGGKLQSAVVGSVLGGWLPLATVVVVMAALHVGVPLYRCWSVTCVVSMLISHRCCIGVD